MLLEMCEHNINKEKNVQLKYLLRQMLVNSGVWTSHFILGLCVGGPTVLVPQLKIENKSDTNNIEQVALLISIFVYSGLPWAIFLPLISSYFGRKVSFLFVCISTMIGFINYYYSNDIKQIIVTEIFHGVIAASQMTTSIIICTEYTSSEYRGMFLTLKGASFVWGILVANSIGTFFHWKNIPLLGMICTSYCLITIYFWPESPLWLAKKGYLDKCSQSHRWLKGTSSNSERELEKIISNNQDKIKKTSIKHEALTTVKSIVKKHFYKAMLICMLLKIMNLFNGSIVCSMFALDILKGVSADTSTAYANMLILDAVSVMSTYIGCILSRLHRRRTLLITFVTISASFLYLFSLYLYLIKLSVLSENVYISLFLLVGFNIAVSCGPTILLMSIAGELLPIEARSLAATIFALSYTLLNGTFVKVSPYLFQSFGMPGTFLFFAISSTICLIVVYIYLPETKDKTLQEIAEIVSGKVYDTVNVIKSVTEAKELLPMKVKRPEITPAKLNNYSV